MDDVFEETLKTSSIRSLRLTERDLVDKKANDGMNLVQLIMTAFTLKLKPFFPLICGEKYERIALLDYLIEKYSKDFPIMSNVDSTGMTAMHSASLLFHGLTPQKILSPQELRSKRLKSYPSAELKILDIIIAEQVENISEY